MLVRSRSPTPLDEFFLYNIHQIRRHFISRLGTKHCKKNLINIQFSASLAIVLFTPCSHHAFCISPFFYDQKVAKKTHKNIMEDLSALRSRGKVLLGANFFCLSVCFGITGFWDIWCGMPSILVFALETTRLLRASKQPMASQSLTASVSSDDSTARSQSRAMAWACPCSGRTHTELVLPPMMGVM